MMEDQDCRTTKTGSALENILNYDSSDDENMEDQNEKNSDISKKKIECKDFSSDPPSDTAVDNESSVTGVGVENLREQNVGNVSTKNNNIVLANNNGISENLFGVAALLRPEHCELQINSSVVDSCVYSSPKDFENKEQGFDSEDIEVSISENTITLTTEADQCDELEHEAAYQPNISLRASPVLLKYKETDRATVASVKGNAQLLSKSREKMNAQSVKINLCHPTVSLMTGEHASVDMMSEPTHLYEITDHQSMGESEQVTDKEVVNPRFEKVETTALIVGSSNAGDTNIDFSSDSDQTKDKAQELLGKINMLQKRRNREEEKVQLENKDTKEEHLTFSPSKNESMKDWTLSLESFSTKDKDVKLKKLDMSPIHDCSNKLNDIPMDSEDGVLHQQKSNMLANPGFSENRNRDNVSLNLEKLSDDLHDDSCFKESKKEGEMNVEDREVNMSQHCKVSTAPREESTTCADITDHQLNSKENTDNKGEQLRLLEEVATPANGTVNLCFRDQSAPLTVDSDGDTDSDRGVSLDNNETDEGSADDEAQEMLERRRVTMLKNRSRTEGEIFPEELPPLEYLTVSPEENLEVKRIGKISGIVDVLVIVQGDENAPSLFDDTVLFLEDRKPLGLIFEVFGTVAKPFFSVRFNSQKDIKKNGITIGVPVFFAPKADNLTKYVFIAELRKMRYNDASWENDNEPPLRYRDFSDDEEEKRSKAVSSDNGSNKLQQKNKRRRKRTLSSEVNDQAPRLGRGQLMKNPFGRQGHLFNPPHSGQMKSMTGPSPQYPSQSQSATNMPHSPTTAQASIPPQAHFGGNPSWSNQPGLHSPSLNTYSSLYNSNTNRNLFRPPSFRTTGFSPVSFRNPSMYRPSMPNTQNNGSVFNVGAPPPPFPHHFQSFGGMGKPADFGATSSSGPRSASTGGHLFFDPSAPPPVGPFNMPPPPPPPPPSHFSPSS